MNFKVFFYFFLLIQFFGCNDINDDNPNVLIFLTDDQGWGDLSINGNPNLKTPNIDQIAKNGARFQRFYVSPVCSPTRAELLTGKFFVRSGVNGVTKGYERMNIDHKLISNFFNMIKESKLYLNYFVDNICSKTDSLVIQPGYTQDINQILNPLSSGGGKNKKLRLKLKNRKNKRNSNNKNSKNKSNK